MGCHFLLQGIFPTQESNPGLPHCRQMIYPLSHQGSLLSNQNCKSDWLEPSKTFLYSNNRKCPKWGFFRNPAPFFCSSITSAIHMDWLHAQAHFIAYSSKNNHFCFKLGTHVLHHPEGNGEISVWIIKRKPIVSFSRPHWGEVVLQVTNWASWWTWIHESPSWSGQLGSAHSPWSSPQTPWLLCLGKDWLYKWKSKLLWQKEQRPGCLENHILLYCISTIINCEHFPTSCNRVLKHCIWCLHSLHGIMFHFKTTWICHCNLLGKEVIFNVLKYYYFSNYSPSLPLRGSSFFSPWAVYLSIIIAIINNTEINMVLCLSIFLPLWLFPWE